MAPTQIAERPATMAATKYGAAVDPGRRDIKPLTALRFFPAMAVVLYHAADYFSCWRGLGNYYIVGQAVTFFFILSGFILTQNYFNLSDIKGAVKFYIARFSRIWPAHVTSLLLLVMLIPEIFRPKGAMLPVFISNMFMTHSWYPSWRVFFSYNAPSWSNATEMFFYLSFPFLLWSMRKRWFFPILLTGSVLGALILACNAAHLPEFDPVKLSNQGVIYINPLSRIFEFAVGMSAALLWRRYLHTIQIDRFFATVLELSVLVGVCALNVYSGVIRYASVPWAGDAGAYWIQNSGPSVIAFSVLILTFACERGYMSRLFSNSFLVLLGELSFGIYMLHGVLITYLGINFPQEQSLSTCLLFLATVFIAAHLMSEIIEKPLRKILMSLGAKLMNRGSDQNKDSLSKKPNVQNTGLKLKKILVIAAELLLLAGLVYTALPTIHRVSVEDIAAQQTTALLEDENLSNTLTLSSVSIAGKQTDASSALLPLHLVWQAQNDQTVNYTVTATALDKNDAPITSLRYKMDGRNQHVKAGDYWAEDLQMQVPDRNLVRTVKIAVRSKNGKELLRASSIPASENYSLAFKL
jgi:peptidoglycan/LPS O-acetylase OafA/YrhL